MPEKIEQYAYLWDGTQPGWVLLRAPELLGGFSIYNKLNKVLLHLDDEKTNLMLCEQMKSIGCEVIEEDDIGS
jgi:hypothetical protein